jgi:hypothetical protein
MLPHPLPRYGYRAAPRIIALLPAPPCSRHQAHHAAVEACRTRKLDSAVTSGVARSFAYWLACAVLVRIAYRLGRRACIGAACDGGTWGRRVTGRGAGAAAGERRAAPPGRTGTLRACGSSVVRGVVRVDPADPVGRGVPGGPGHAADLAPSAGRGKVHHHAPPAGTATDPGGDQSTDPAHGSRQSPMGARARADPGRPSSGTGLPSPPSGGSYMTRGSIRRRGAPGRAGASFSRRRPRR